MKELACSQEQFDKDVADHGMDIQLNQDLFRHIKYSRHGSSSYHFNITTWPGYLCISGDMGCHVFARTSDMFTFFRGQRINPGYWAEKLQTKSQFGGVHEFSSELFMSGFKDRIQDYLNGMDLTEEQQEQVVALAVAEFDYVDVDQTLYCQKAYEFSFSDLDLPEDLEGIEFPNFQVDELWTMEEYTFHFIWCLRAIVWAIAKFDDAVGKES